MRLRDVRRLPRKAASAARYEALALARRCRVESDVVVYEAFAGAGMVDNPEAIFSGLRSDPHFAHLKHVWVIADAGLRRRLEREWRHDRDVTFVPHTGPRYWRALARAGYLINNATFPPEFAKRPGQVYLNTWHGSPLKRMGYDMPDGPRESANTLRNFVQADWLLSQNSFMTDTMYRRAYLLDGVFAGEVIEEGYPRTDRQHLDEAQRAAVREQLTARGLELGDRQILLYAPTWKGDRFSEVVDDVAELVATVHRLQEQVGDRYAVLLKAHQSVFRFALNDPWLRGVLVPNDIPTNTVLGVTDLLVTDYSSIQFDYVGTRRPLAYYVPDLGQYADSRGHYLPVEEWPGPLSSTIDELVDSVRALSQSPHDAWAARRQEWAARFTPADDGEATERVIDVVFRGVKGRRSRQLRDDARPKALFYIGGLRPNGITSAAVTLVNALAESGTVDVSVVYGRPQAENRRRSAERLSRKVRQFMRQGGMNATRLDHLRRRRGGPEADAVWQDEWRRVFGDARFDTVVDFSGYTPFWARLMLAAPASRRLIWLHNDLARDAQRTVAGRQHLHGALTGTFALYDRFDELVSVSPELARINQAALAEYAAPEKFAWVPNLIDASAVRADAAVPLDDVRSEAISADRPDLADAVDRLSRTGDTRWFAAVGRLSPEKNHARLIRAFASVHAAERDARLLIIGDGPLRDDLEALVRGASLSDAVVFAGATPRPAALLAHADCFVLSSDYEGMPMVLLEAAVLGMRIITTRFGSVSDALPGVQLRIAEQDDDDLARAMLDFLSGKVPATQFDAEQHNANAISRAYEALFPQVPATR